MHGIDSVTSGFIEFIIVVKRQHYGIGAKQVNYLSFALHSKQYDITMIYAGGDLTQAVWTLVTFNYNTEKYILFFFAFRCCIYHAHKY